METKEERKARIKEQIAKVNANLRSKKPKKAKVNRIRTPGVSITEVDYPEAYRRIDIVESGRQCSKLSPTTYRRRLHRTAQLEYMKE
jgi:hypothetical protein